MDRNTNIVGKVYFDGRELDAYSSLDNPIFKAGDIAKMIDYSPGNTWGLLDMCEDDEKLKLTMVVAGQKRAVNFVTENGLYNILSQSRKPTARKWRRIIHDEIIRMRKVNNKNIIQQFDEWDDLLQTLYIDEETGILMQSVTVQGGDVEQIPYER